MDCLGEGRPSILLAGDDIVAVDFAQVVMAPTKLAASAAWRAGRPARCGRSVPGCAGRRRQGDRPAARLAGKPCCQAGELGIQPAGEQVRAVLGHDLRRGQDLVAVWLLMPCWRATARTADAAMTFTVAVIGQQCDQDPLHATPGRRESGLSISQRYP